jgi:hypothetical protein
MRVECNSSTLVRKFSALPHEPVALTAHLQLHARFCEVLGAERLAQQSFSAG